jgi:hypothetical protein
MIRYPLFNASCADVRDVSTRSGVPVDIIDAILRGDHAAGLAEQMRLGRALGINPLDLFALDDDIESALADVVAQGHPRYATDRTALRVIDR